MPAEDVVTAHALDMWRCGEAIAAGLSATHWAADYARAIAAMLDALQPCATLDKLVEAWYDMSTEALLERACSLPTGRTLQWGTVQDAAFWRRWQQLMAPAMVRR
jgi:hypothetical protein